MDGRVSLAELPLAFREAIQVCNGLGIRYLWIDSICLVKSGDDGKDWLFHAREMSRIYSACFLNIAVEHASDPGEGIFSRRQLHELIAIPANVDPSRDKIRKSMARFAKPFSKHTGPVGLPVARGRMYEMSLTALNTPWAFVNRTKLFARGGVLQERLLSPRTLHFSRHGIAWSCYEHITTERSERIHSTGDSGFRINKDILSPCSETDLHAAENKCSVWLWWKDLIEDYSQRQLSFPQKDKLVALAGIIEVFNNRRGVEYVAGMFLDMLHWSLLWEVDTKHVDNSQNTTKQGPKSWTSFSQELPSWSWASVNAPVLFPLLLRQPVTP